MKCFIFVKAFSFGRQLFLWSGDAMDGHYDSWQANMFRGRFQLIYQQVSLLVPAISNLSGEITWSGFDKYLAYVAKSRHDDSWQGRTFWASVCSFG